jgi:hypothetical protein
VKFPERQLAVEIQRDEKMFACPRDIWGLRHASRLPELVSIAKRENACHAPQTWPGVSAEL